MKPELHIEKNDRVRKIRPMERLWDSLTKVPEEFSSPQWHKSILEKRHQEAQKNPNKFLDFEDAKKCIDNAIKSNNLQS